jgi:hypothetical protein
MDYTGEMVVSAIDRVMEYKIRKFDSEFCMNVAKNPSACRCLTQLTQMRDDAGQDSSGNENALYFHVACEEMAAWFNRAGSLERRREAGEIDQSTVTRELVLWVWIKSQYEGRAHTTMLNMASTNAFPAGIIGGIRGTSWKGHDWDVNVRELNFQYHSAMCLPSALMVWRSLVGGNQWETTNSPAVAKWLKNDYAGLLSKMGRYEVQEKKQKKMQRLFYSRIPDYMNAKEDAIYVKFDKCFRIHALNGWTTGAATGKAKQYLLRKEWGKWNLNQIHVLRGNSDMEYDKPAAVWRNQMKIRVASISEETMDYVEKVFGMVRDGVKKWWKVSRDRKLLFVPFKECHNLESAIKWFYGKVGTGGRATGKMKSLMASEKYEMEMKKCDKEIKDALMKMGNVNSNKLAFQTSMIATEVHMPQDPHIDYDSKKEHVHRYMVAFLPLTETGMFLQLWSRSVNNLPVRGKIVFIPRGQLVLVPGNTIHAGGFRADHRNDNQRAHFRLHFYVYPNEDECAPIDHKNEYVDVRNNVYLQNEQLASTATNLQTSFFEGSVGK